MCSMNTGTQNLVIPGILFAFGLFAIASGRIYKYRERRNGSHAGELADQKLAREIREEAALGAQVANTRNEQANTLRREKGWQERRVGIVDVHSAEITRILRERGIW